MAQQQHPRHQQEPTFTGLRVRTRDDAHVLFHAVALGVRPMVARRLEPEERRHICAGSVFVWEERAAADAPAGGIERWTDGRRWGPSRARDDFLFYHEKLPELDADPELAALILGSRLQKQTASVYVQTAAGRRKWHLVAYAADDARAQLRTVAAVPALAALRGTVPPGAYVPARSARARGRRRGSRPAPAPAPAGAEAPRRARARTQLAPLAYLRARPYAPRHPADSDALAAFDRAR